MTKSSVQDLGGFHRDELAQNTRVSFDLAGVQSSNWKWLRLLGLTANKFARRTHGLGQAGSWYISDRISQRVQIDDGDRHALDLRSELRVM